MTLSAAILGRLGDPDRFANLAGVRSFTGLVPKVDESGLERRHKGITKAGDPGLRESLFMAADLARKVDPALAARHHRLVVAEGRHHTSATCAVAAVLVTRIAACWRRGERYVLRDVDGTPITEAEGRAICSTRYRVTAEQRAARRRVGKPQQLKQRAGRGRKESTEAAPASSPPDPDAIEAA